MTYAMMGGMAEPVGARISAALRETLERSDVSQVAIAERLGVDQPTISRWVRGMRRPPLDAIVEIEAALGLPKGTVLRRAGYVNDDPSDVITAINNDPHLDEAFKPVAVDFYRSLLKRSKAATRASQAAQKDRMKASR